MSDHAHDTFVMKRPGAETWDVFANGDAFVKREACGNYPSRGIAYAAAARMTEPPGQVQVV
jgi:hypothetical protein